MQSDRISKQLSQFLKRDVMFTIGRLFVLGYLSLIGCGNSSSPSEVDLTQAIDSTSGSLRTLIAIDDTGEDGTGTLMSDGESVILRVVSVGSQRALTRIGVLGAQDSLFARIAVLPDSLFNANSSAGVQLSFEPYNDLADGGSGFSDEGDVGFILSFEFLDGVGQFAIASYRRTGNGRATENPVLDGQTFVTLQQLFPIVGTSYNLSISVDRSEQTVSFAIDNQTFTYALPTSLYRSATVFAAASARTNFGAATASARVSDIGADGISYPLSALDNMQF